ncbi:hypothetical protein ACN42_g11445 [Penicillium freii]|uniref:Uncharacterized protein n=1 Tax=Penicillium freii TaxID=48697 RepID=A0A117NKB2_PENFR|nr:hypothetical protein ACN42_g11445 [Penicillium freii]
MGLSSCYWLYDIQHGVSHDVLTSQLEDYRSRKRLVESQKINKKEKATPNVPQEDTYAFEEFTGATLISSGVFHVIT